MHELYTRGFWDGPKHGDRWQLEVCWSDDEIAITHWNRKADPEVEPHEVVRIPFHAVTDAARIIRFQDALMDGRIAENEDPEIKKAPHEWPNTMGILEVMPSVLDALHYARQQGVKTITPEFITRVEKAMEEAQE